MAQACFECNREVGNTSLIFKKSDLVINHISVPKQMTEGDILCVNCYDQRLKSPTTNLSKARIDKLVNIYEKEMDKNEIKVESILKKLVTELNQWSLTEPVKTDYLVQVMDIIEVAIQDESNKLSALNQMRKTLSLNFDVKTRPKDQD